jgi:centrosomal protein CEP290
LEKTIALLKKVVERTQAENERLKKAPGVVSNVHQEALQLENIGLKVKCHEQKIKLQLIIIVKEN